MARGTATRVASRHKRVSQAGFPDGAETVARTGQRSQDLIHRSKGNFKTIFLYSAEQRSYITVGALKTTVLDIIIACFIFLDALVIIQD